MQQISTVMILPIILACLAAPGFWTLLQKFYEDATGKKKVKLEDIDKKLDSQQKDIDGLKDSFTKFQGAESEKDAESARRRILRFNDELLRKVDHSKEYFDDILEDIKVYENYCDSHPSFENGKTGMADKNIRRCYEQCMEKNSFLKS